MLVSSAFAGSAAAAEPALSSTGQSQAVAQFLSGSLLNGGIPFNNLLVTLFGLPIINQPNGIPVNLGPASPVAWPTEPQPPRSP